MSIVLTQDMERLIARKVEAGAYGSAAEVVREALELLDERDEWRAASLRELRDEVAIGLDQVARGQVGPLDMPAIRAAAEARAASRAKDP